MDIGIVGCVDRCLDSSFVVKMKQTIPKQDSFNDGDTLRINIPCIAVLMRQLKQEVLSGWLKSQQTARNFKTDKHALEKEYLKQYAQEQRLTGLLY